MDEGSKGTRDRILDAALDLFVEKGYDKASLRELAEKMGFTKAALYYHFPSKADILMALHERMHGILDGPLAVLDSGPQTLDTFEKFLDACIEEIQTNQKLFMLHRVNQAALTKLHNEGHEGAHIELEERARKLFSDPALSPGERLRMTSAFAVAFVTPMMNIFVLDQPAEDEIPIADLKQIVHQVLRAR
jgi:AcrR family transcriptional regulator